MKKLNFNISYIQATEAFIDFKGVKMEKEIFGNLQKLCEWIVDNKVTFTKINPPNQSVSMNARSSQISIKRDKSVKSRTKNCNLFLTNIKTKRDTRNRKLNSDLSLTLGEKSISLLKTERPVIKTENSKLPELRTMDTRTLIDTTLRYWSSQINSNLTPKAKNLKLKTTLIAEFEKLEKTLHEKDRKVTKEGIK